MASLKRTVLAALLSGTFAGEVPMIEPVGETRARGSEVPYWVYLCDGTNLSPLTLRLVEREVRRPFERAGLKLFWVASCPEKPLNLDRPLSARVYVLHEMPQPILTMPGFVCGDSRRPLGIVLTSENEPPGEVIYVSRRAIDTSIQRASIAPSMPKRARAVGRVIIHELAHRFLSQTTHSTPGILRGDAIHPRELTAASSRNFRFSESEVERLHTVLYGEGRRGPF